MKITKFLILTALILSGLVSASGLVRDLSSPTRHGASAINLVEALTKSESYGFGYLFNQTSLQSTDETLAPAAAGDIDPTFAGGVMNTGFDPNSGAIQAIAVQPDGKHLIGGNFSMVSGTGRNYIVRLNANGTVDPTFDSGVGFNNTVWSIKVQPDGKILVAGDFTAFTDLSGVNARGRIARLNADGSLDTDFAIGSAANARIRAMELQSDGKILIGGEFTSVDGSTRRYIARLNTDGSNDLSFTQTTGFNSGVRVIKVQSDGKILVGGDYTNYNGTAINYFARLNTNGSLDTSFNVGTALNNYVQSIAIQSNGKIIISGAFSLYNASSAALIARLNSDGSQDTTFFEGSNCAAPQTACRNITPGGAGGITIMPNGQIYISQRGWNPNGQGHTNTLIRLNADGARDMSFQVPFGGGDGEYPSRHAVQSDGLIITARQRIVSGVVAQSTYVTRFNPDGSEDGTYTPIFGSRGGIYTILKEPDGKVIVGGSFNIANSTVRLNLGRFNTDGSIDTTFSARTNGLVQEILRQPDGKILIFGNFDQVNGVARGRLARLNANGSVDTTFNVQVGAGNYIYGAALQLDGKIIIVGQFDVYSGTPRNRIARINTDGSLDTSFTPPTTYEYMDWISGVAIQPDGKIVVSGNFRRTSNQHQGLMRLNSDGTADTSFNNNPGTTAVDDVQLMPDGKMIIVGDFGGYSGVIRTRIARINADGTLDASFGNSAQPNGRVFRAHVQADGKVIFVGAFTTVSGQIRRGIARVNTDNTLDTTFGNNLEGAQPWDGGLGLFVNEAAGRLYYGAGFTTFNNVGRGSLVRLFTGTGQPQTFTISGNITRNSSALSGVAVALTGTTTGNTTTDASGNYSFTGLTSGGNYTVTPTLANNTFTPPSTSFTNLTANQTANFTAALNCSYSLSPASPQTVAAAAGTLNVTVTTPAGCAWTAVSNSAFLTVTGGSSGNQTSTVNISIAANTGAARSGTLTIAGQTYTINQQDGTQNCTYSINPTSANVANTAGSGSFTVTTQTGCAWTAQSSSSFLTSSSSGTGSGTVNYSYTANTGAARTATIAVGGQAFTLNQGGVGCTNGVSVGLPSQNASQNTTLTVPITVGDTTGRNITAFDFDLRFDPAIVRPLAAQPTDNAGTISANFTITPNAGTAGRLVVSGFGINPLSGAGTLLNLKFEVIGNPQQTAALNWQTFQFNEGDPAACISPGQITVVNGSIAGVINYHFVPTGGTPRAMANVTVTGAGTPQVSAATNASGAYLLNNFGSGAYTVTPAKTGDVNGISSLDASRVAQFAAGLVTLTANQQIAADTTNNGSVSSLDASRLAQYVAGIANTGITGQWKFAPASRNYASVTTQMTGENYDAILVGEVTGNWTAPAVLSGDKEGLPPAADEQAETKPAAALPPVTVSLPSQNVQPGATITVPITVGDTTGQNITAYDFDLRFDPSVIQPVAGNPASNAGTISANFTITPNPNTPGRLVVSAFGIAPIAGAGTLLNLNFQVVGQSGTSGLTWQTFVFNEGDPAATTSNGSVTIPSACSYTLNPTAATATPTGGAGSFTVTTAAGCTWTAASSDAWLTTSSSGTGSGTVNYSAAANTGAARSASITVGGQTFTVNQAAVIVTRRAPFDFDGDGKTDVGIFRPSDGSWWYMRSVDNNSTFRVFRFGVSTDVLTPGDWTGDGKADIAVFRPSTGFWFVQRSEDNSFFSFPFGASGDVPAPGDYDRDGKTDAAVYRPSTGTWFILNSGGAGTTIVNFGIAEDKPVPADYDGDGKTDIAIFRPSDGSWWYLRSSDNQFRVFRFGTSTDKPVPGDWTGDGKADLAVFRPSTGEWFVQRSEDNSYFSFPFGASGDVPAPGDYDGDGKFDAGVFRPSTGVWYVQRSTAGSLITGFGSGGDRPIPNSFVP